MKIDDAIIDKVLNNEASAEEAGKVAEWFATEKGSRYLSERLENESLRRPWIGWTIRCRKNGCGNALWERSNHRKKQYLIVAD